MKTSEFLATWKCESAAAFCVYLVNILLTGIWFVRHAFLTQVMQAEGLGWAYRSWRRNWKGRGREYVGRPLVEALLLAEF